MKKGFVIYSVIIAVLVCWSFLFKLMHWPGGNMMVLISAVLGIIAVVWGACVHTKLGKLGKGVVIFNAITLVLTIIGLWFKVAHWPGGYVLCMLCLGILLPMSFIWTAVSYNKLNK